MTLRYTTSDYLQNLVVDRMTTRCLTRPPQTCDSDVAGLGAALNDNSMEVDVDVPSVCEKSTLFDLVKYPNMQLASKYCEDVLGVLLLVIYLLPMIVCNSLLVFVSGKEF